ncbi:MAG: hypothetical protein L0H93_02465 [Nocardioides sp.]|nr:hypothetical protein [Nocardioides sp.]
MADEERIAGICAHCAELFSRVIASSLPDDTWARHYCQTSCAEAATTVRTLKCPHPEKRHFTGEGAAMEAATSAAKRHRKAHRWYLCPCGQWCLTTWCAPSNERTVGPSSDNGTATALPLPKNPGIPTPLRHIA